MRFAEKFFTGEKSDPQHLPSIKSCLIRVPGTINSKNGEEVKVIQRWDGNLPAIQQIAKDFRHYLIQKRIDKIKEREREKEIRSRIRYTNSSKTTTNTIGWIEKLLQTPINDYRKTCLWSILCPYLINVKKLSGEEATVMLKEWLQKCDSVEKTDFNHHQQIKTDLKSVKSFLPPSLETVKNKHQELHHLLKSRSVL